MQNPSDFYSDVIFDNLCCLWIVLINSFFQVVPQKIVRRVEIWGIGWPEVIGSTQDESVPWEVLPEEFKCWNTTVFISMPLFLLNARNDFLRITSMYHSALMVTQFPSLSSKMYCPKILPLPTAHHTVTFSWLNGRWVCLWGSWDAQNLMFCLLTFPLKWKWALSLNRIKPRSPGLFSILSLTVWQNLLLSSLLASVYFWRICALYGNNFKSLWMILCIAVLEMLTSWDSRRVDFHGDCSRCFLSAWALARVLTATYHPLWLLLSFPTLPVFLNFSTIFVILFLHGGFLSGNSLWNSHWVMTTDFVEE